MLIPTLRVIALLAILYNAWIVFRVADDWGGIALGIAAVLLLPISTVVMAIAMLFVPSSAAGPLALWPGIMLIGFLDWLARRNNGTLLLGMKEPT